MAEQTTPENDSPKDPEGQARQQTGQPQVRVRVDERDMTTSYANAFRANPTADEVMIDFGINLPAGNPQDGQPEIAFQISDRIVMNFYAAKRLALALGQIVRRYEQEFGELEMDVAKRRKSGK